MTVQQHARQWSAKVCEPVVAASAFFRPLAHLVLVLVGLALWMLGAIGTSESLATPAEVARFMRTTAAKLANDRYLGVGLPYLKFNRRVLYRWSDVHRYVEANLTRP